MNADKFINALKCFGLQMSASPKQFQRVGTESTSYEIIGFYEGEKYLVRLSLSDKAVELAEPSFVEFIHADFKAASRAVARSKKHELNA